MMRNLKNRLGRHVMLLTGVILVMMGRPAAAQWSIAQPVWNAADPNEANGTNAIKDPRIAGGTGGFHLTYRLFINNGPIENRYRRYSGGTLGPVRVVQSGIFTANSWIAEAGNGDVHLVWENFAATLDVGWARSTDGGNTFSSPIVLANCGCDATKFPGIAPFGSGTSADMVMAVADVSGDRQIKYQRWNGSAWAPASAQSFGSCDSEYFATGICQSQQDGSVYRTYGRKVNNNPETFGLFYRRYNGTSWEAEQTVMTSIFYAYPYIAVNQAGQIMVVWEQDGRIDSRWYTPGIGWAPVTVVDSHGSHGQVTAIPGTNHFYVVHSTRQQIVEGRYWINGQWQPKTTVSVGQPNNGATFDPTARVSAGPTRELYASWENWDSGNARGYFSTLTQPQIIAIPSAISRTVWIGNNPTSDSFLVTNGGPGTIAYTATPSHNWLSVTPGGGTTAGDDDILTINYDTASLHRGIHTAGINVAGNAPNSPRAISVQLTVQSVQPDFDGDGDVDQADFGHFQACMAGSLETLPAGCATADLQNPVDGDVDAGDFAEFLKCVSGADVPANPTCYP